MLAKLVELERRGDEDSTFRALVIQIGGNDERRRRQCLYGWKRRAPAVAQKKPARFSAALADAIRIRECKQKPDSVGRRKPRVDAEQPPQPVRLISRQAKRVAIDILPMPMRRRAAGAKQLDAKSEVGVDRWRPATQHIAIAEKRRDLARKPARAKIPSAQKHVCQTRVNGQRVHSPAMIGNRARLVDCVQLAEQLARLPERCVRWRIQPAQLEPIIHAGCGKIQRER